jgi:rubrerythrin
MASAALAAKKNWVVDDIAWDRFDAAKVNPELLKIVKAASLVEYNGNDYAVYLCNVFKNDLEFQQAAKDWALEEVQHGVALARWAEMADPSFDFQRSFAQFKKGYTFELEVKESVRGSLAGELIARCIVETGTSSYYTALADACEEPVLKQICQNIAGDELRHYKLFYTYLTRYLEKEKLSAFERVKVGLSRIGESEDDELAYAYFAANYAGPNFNAVANDNSGVAYNRQQCSDEYAARAYPCYQAKHMDRVVNMVFKACGLNPQGWLAKAAGKLAWYSLSARVKKAKCKVLKAA